jgi:hypothetical protein
MLGLSSADDDPPHPQPSPLLPIYELPPISKLSQTFFFSLGGGIDLRKKLIPNNEICFHSNTTNQKVGDGGGERVVGVWRCSIWLVDY